MFNFHTTLKMANNRIGYLIASDFTENGELHGNLRPALVMIKAGNCRFCQLSEPDFREFYKNNPAVNCFFMRPYDGKDVREKKTQEILYDIVRTEDFGFPTFVFYPKIGERNVSVGSASIEDLYKMLEQKYIGANLSMEMFKPYNAV